MSWLNYTHLKCLWATVREGSVSAASRALHVSQPTVSAHLKSLEEAVGEPLVHRSRSGVTLTERGRIVFRYAEEIFRLSTELEGAVRGGRTWWRLVSVSGLLTWCLRLWHTASSPRRWPSRTRLSLSVLKASRPSSCSDSPAGS